jgi:hypothetical protein
VETGDSTHAGHFSQGAASDHVTQQLLVAGACRLRRLEELFRRRLSMRGNLDPKRRGGGWDEERLPLGMDH